MKKWIIVGAIVVTAVVVFLFVGISNLGPIIKNAVNTYGPRMTQTEVRLGDVGLSLLSGQANLKDLFVGNPEGFGSSAAMKVGSIHVDVDERSLAGDTVIIDKIEVVRPEITYEKVGRRDNFQTILKNLKRTTGAGEPSGKEAHPKGDGKKIAIRDLMVRGGKVHLSLSMAGLVEKKISTSLPDIHLKDVGQGGAPAPEVFETIFTALYSEITSPAVTKQLNQELKALGLDGGAVGDRVKEKVEAVGETAKEELEAVTDKVKGLLGK